MANEKLFTAKQAANAVLEKVGEILKKSNLQKKYGDMNKAESASKNAAIAPKKVKKPDSTADTAPEEDTTAAPEATPAAAATPAATAAPVAPPAAPAAAAPVAPAATPSTGDTNTETGGSSPGGASTGGVGSGIGGAGTGGAATGGASTGGAGTVNLTISGNSGTGSNGEGKSAPITINISNVGGRTDAGDVASGDGPGAEGEGGSGEGSGGGGGGAAPDEPDDYSTGKDAQQAKSTDKKKMKKSENAEESMFKTEKIGENFSGMHKVEYFKTYQESMEKAEGALNVKPGRGEVGGEKGVHRQAGLGAKPGMSNAGVAARIGQEHENAAPAPSMHRVHADPSGHLGAAKEWKDKAVATHKQVLGDLKAMPKPNLPKSEDIGKSEIGSAAGRSDGHYSDNADPGEPKAGKASKPGKCPECGHPTVESGQGDTLPRTKAQEDWQEDGSMKKYETSNSKKMGYKLSEAGKETVEPEKSDHAFEVEGEKSKKSSDDARLAHQKDPQHNAAEQKEGNNELAGTTPTQVGQDGKNKPGYDEMKGHLKLAKFIGMKHYKRGKSLEGSQSQSSAEAQHKEAEKGK